MSQAIIGTWRFLKYADGRDRQLPGSYTFNADGSGSFNLPNGFSVAMTWKLILGRLRFGGPGGDQQATIRVHCPNEDTLVMTDSDGVGAIYQRVRG